MGGVDMSGLAPGSRFGTFDVVSLIGAGGMGQVYRARDTELHRDVAIKVLQPEVADDPDRLARFSREAQVLASLNHPNIAHLYGLEQAGDVRALVMELVEGPTLEERLKAQGSGHAAAEAESLRSRPRDSEAPSSRGGGAPRGLEIDDVLAIARQIAEALDAAHEQGVIHRDLKPANVKVREDGTVKVLDFGLAKAMEYGAGAAGRAGGEHRTHSPTITTPAMTQAGMILGTAAYMSPEQARGKAVDKRADIWAFGCVLYELLSGRRAFAAEEVSDTLAFVLTKEPDWSVLPPGTPAAIRTLLTRCLDKDPRRRLRDIGEVRVLLSDPRSLWRTRSRPRQHPRLQRGPRFGGGRGSSPQPASLLLSRRAWPPGCCA